MSSPPRHFVAAVALVPAALLAFACGGSGATGGQGGGPGGGSGGSAGTGGGAAGVSGNSGAGGTTATGGAGGATARGGAGGATARGGAGGATATGGAGGTTATGGVGGATATGGAGGATATGGAGGTHGGTPEICAFQVSGALSPAIPTVGIINWSTDLAGLTEARIEFTLNAPAADEINRGSGGKIDVAGTTHRALMLGLKAERTYTYRIVATGGGKVCTSADQMLTTGAATGAPTVTRTAPNAAAQARGFIVTCEFPDGGAARARMAYIIDADGDVVWWAAAPSSCSRALIDWEGANMWMVQASGGATNLETRRIGMDGMDALNNVGGLVRAHHDIAAVPGGIVAALVWAEGNDARYASDLVERSPDGTMKTVVRLDGKIFKPQPDMNLFHSNSILYHPADDSYTVGDIYARAYVKLTRQGKLLWQLGADCAGVPAPKCATGGVDQNHGQHLLANGNIIFFNSQFSGGTSTIYEYSLTETGTALTASKVWSYQVPGLYSRVLGDVQRLPNGNTLVTFSTNGQMHEVSPSGSLVQTLSASTAVPFFAYATFRETLYGPPPR